MPPRPASANLNPFAPAYIPILPGVSPSRHAPPTYLLHPPPSAAHSVPYPPPSSSYYHQTPPPPPVFPSPQIFTYIPSISQQQPFYTYRLTHRFTPQNEVRANPPPPLRSLPPRPPPQVEGVTHSIQTRRGCSRPRVGGRRGRGSLYSSRADNNGLGSSLNSERSFNNERSTLGVSNFRKSSQTRGKKGENKHNVMPVTRDEEKTTVMIRNIPYDCPRKELISLLDDFCLLENEKAKNEGSSSNGEAVEALTYAYDFVYLPIDFRTKRSRGFAFVNFTNARAVWRFCDAFHYTKWGWVDRHNWPKVVEIVSAEIQGKEALVTHFKESAFECETDEFLPACFSPPRDGFGQPVKLTVVGKRLAPPLGADRPK